MKSTRKTNKVNNNFPINRYKLVYIDIAKALNSSYETLEERISSDDGIIHSLTTAASIEEDVVWQKPTNP